MIVIILFWASIKDFTRSYLKAAKYKLIYKIIFNKKNCNKIILYYYDLENFIYI